jgi:hypothetical protein
VSFWLQARYFCVNKTAGCPYAVGEAPYSAEYFGNHAGLCRGRGSDGCGGALALGEPKDLRPRWALFGAVTLAEVIGVLVLLRMTLFPPPLEHVGFVDPALRTDDGVGVLELQVTRDRDLQNRIRVEFASADGSAKAGEDYQSVHNRLTFEPGERTKSIRVAVAPDQTLAKASRSFTLILLNVRGTPKETVRIDPRGAARTQEVQAAQSVASASRIAADIGGYMVKRRVLRGLLEGHAGTDAEVKEFQEQLQEVEGNLDRAREGYAQSLHDLQTFDRTMVIHAMDDLHTNLVDRHFTQQSRAVEVMRSQFTELEDKRSMDMDRWVAELEGIVPHVGANNPESST